MADSPIIIDLGDLKGWTPYEGLGANDHLTHDGLFEFVIVKLKSDVSDGEKTKGAPMLTVAVDIVDPDNAGKHLVRNVMAGGKDKNGEPLARQFGEFLNSLAQRDAKPGEPFSKEWIAATLAAYGQQPLDTIVAQLGIIGRKGIAQIATSYYKQEAKSDIENFKTYAEYDKAKAANTHRKPHRPAPQFSGPPAGFAPTAGAPGLPALPGMPGLPGLPGLPNGTNGVQAGGVADPLKSMTGLQLPPRA